MGIRGNKKPAVPAKKEQKTEVKEFSPINNDMEEICLSCTLQDLKEYKDQFGSLWPKGSDFEEQAENFDQIYKECYQKAVAEGPNALKSALFLAWAELYRNIWNKAIELGLFQEDVLENETEDVPEKDPESEQEAEEAYNKAYSTVSLHKIAEGFELIKKTPKGQRTLQEKSFAMLAQTFLGIKVKPLMTTPLEFLEPVDKSNSEKWESLISEITDLFYETFEE